ncbi:MAG: GntR family transcriptional regulator [Chloroflexi bacterium OHK40]
MTNGPPLPQLGPALLRQRVLTTLRDAIICGRFRPGDRLVEEELCQQLGVSRGPVREALRQLEQEGLVLSFPYRATEVIGVSLEEVREVLIPIRLTLERFAFRHALPRLTPADVAELERLIATMAEAAGGGNLAPIVEADVRFHELVLLRSEQPHCLQIWRAISPRVRAFFYRSGPRHASLAEIADEHRELLAAMRTGDVEHTLAVLEPHILVDALLGALAKSSEG